MTDTTLAGLAFFQALNSSDECAHAAYPEVVESEWVASVIVQAMQELERIMMGGVTPDDLARCAEHAFLTVAGAGVALGRALASDALMDSFSLGSVDWDSLPEFTPEDSDTSDTEEE